MAEGGQPDPAQQPPPQPSQQPLQPQQAQQVYMCMNWSHFKPEYSGKLEQDEEAHLLRTNNWLNTYDFLMV